MNTYLALRHVHILCVILSGTGFFIRGLLMWRDSPLLQQRSLKIVPHVNDTLLLSAAIGLAVLTQQYPLVSAWVTAKVAGLLLYIVLGALALRPGRRKRVRVMCWLAALLVFVYIVSVALTHDPRGFWLYF